MEEYTTTVPVQSELISEPVPVKVSKPVPLHWQVINSIGHRMVTASGSWLGVYLIDKIAGQNQVNTHSHDPLELLLFMVCGLLVVTVIAVSMNILLHRKSWRSEIPGTILEGVEWGFIYSILFLLFDPESISSLFADVVLTTLFYVIIDCSRIFARIPEKI